MPAARWAGAVRGAARAVAARDARAVFVTQPAFAPDLARFLMESAAPFLPWPARPADISRIVARSLVPTPA